MGILVLPSVTTNLYNSSNSYTHSKAKINNDQNIRRDTDIISLLQQNRKNLKHVESIHGRAIKKGTEQDSFVVFELVRIYCKLKSIDHATKLFHSTHNPNVYLYTSLIDGFVSFGSYSAAIGLYGQMGHNNVLPDSYVVTSVLKACVLQPALRCGREVHGQVLKSGLGLDRSVALKLIELYGKCDEVEDARKVFDKIPERDVVARTVMMASYFDHGMVEEAIEVFNGLKTQDTVCWTAMIDGLVRNGELNRGLEMFREMQVKGVEPNEVTFVCVLSACSQLGALELSRWIHMYMHKCNVKFNQIVVGALINMYSRCGDIDEAQLLFDDMKVKDVSSYNSMICGLALHGMSTEAIELFREMLKQGISPNSITFVGVLNACSHGGLVELGFEIFQSMETLHGIKPHIEHHGCMVDILGRVGRLEEAYNFIERMGAQHVDDKMLCALLSSCKIHRNSEVGEQVAKRLSECSKMDSGSYIMLSNFYASLGRWNFAAEFREKMEKGGILKEPGCSSIEVNNVIHEFLSGDLKHHERRSIYQKLEELNYLTKLEGYSPATEVALHDIDDKQKELALAVHSERLAISYGLISTEPHTTLRVVKNLRICDDCHAMIKLIAKITSRKIVVRDRNRFHHFENGHCSCKDYW
ncbi:putative pentatricopeptide repeat-containing protein At5g59200, chloroplastic [Arachis duranensis]|uniref:Pentatricopeptide repeat-containing protein At5g59200, chloroplastic n=1 Tax=Arachis duranensis TaxID=130453 RepID=A0A6P4DLN4_ARADU|nr:putative pentatricopeptide repeat-containing protein At5g59200, chloroplastic [Arachis duranensis]